ncbi:MAG: putative sugar nucleotidyl transferase [Planctomycetia bacterium]|nr:putative sugar nucleotidyl transferase [Planctomycetia bacterium]
MKTILFEDSQVEQLYPITTGRGAFAITCGTLRMVDLLGKISDTLGILCRPYLEAISRHEYPEHVFGLQAIQEVLRKMPPEENVLVVNARMVPQAGILLFLQQRASESRPSLAKWQDAVAMAVLPAAVLREKLDVFEDGFYDLSEILLHGKWDDFSEANPTELFDYPHDLVRNNMRIFTENIEFRLKNAWHSRRDAEPGAEGAWREIRDGVFVGNNVSLGDYFVADTSHGPILVDHGASIGPFCYIKGPVYIGPHSKVIEHAALKDFVGLAHTTKVGGEVEASTIEPYTNKQHHGFLGHSYLGSWINLGAGTCNSDLKNTYGTISMTYGEGRMATAMQFHGCIIGDYSKTAINTSIFTGKIIGSCSMVYGFVTRNVPSFVNYARSFGQCTELPVEVMCSTQQRMFARRNVLQRPFHQELLHQMFRLTKEERQMENEPLSL